MIAADDSIQTSTWPEFSDDEVAAVSRVLRSGKVNYWTGTEARTFEQEYANHCGVSHAVAVANGTVGLELALKALGVGKGDEVILPCRTFVATASSVVLCGATPIFADVDRDSQNITAESIQQVLTSRTRAIIVVHLAGWPCEMQPIIDLAKRQDLRVIEDCAQAHGALYNGAPVGSFSDVGVFSFCQDKIITTGGEGGMVVTNDPHVWSRAWSYKDHGKSYSAVREAQSSRSVTFKWLHESFGTNWRMTEMQAVIGRLQLQKLERWVEHRQRCAAYLDDRLADFPGLRVTAPPSHVRHAYYKYYAFVDPHALRPGWNRDRIISSMVERGFALQTGSCSEVYLEKCFQDAKMGPESRLPVASELGRSSLLLNVDPTVRIEYLERFAGALADTMAQAARV